MDYRIARVATAGPHRPVLPYLLSEVDRFAADRGGPPSGVGRRCMRWHRGVLIANRESRERHHPIRCCSEPITAIGQRMGSMGHC